MSIVQEVHFVFGINALFIISAIVLIFLEHLHQKVSEATTISLLQPIHQIVNTVVFDAIELRSSVKVPIYGHYGTDHLHTAEMKLLSMVTKDLEKYITITKYPALYHPYETLESSIFIGVKQ